MFRGETYLDSSARYGREALVRKIYVRTVSMPISSQKMRASAKPRLALCPPARRIPGCYLVIDTDVCFISSLQTASVCCELLTIELILEPIIHFRVIPFQSSPQQRHPIMVMRMRTVARRINVTSGTILHSANLELRQPRGYRDCLKAHY